MKLFFKERSKEMEWMDDLSMEGETLRQTLQQIARVNQLLGGIHVVCNGLNQIVQQNKQKKEWVICDYGCGGGEIARAICDFCRKKGIRCKIYAIDANSYTIDYARALSLNYPEIEFRVADVFNSEGIQADISTASLFLHHFTEEEIQVLIKKWMRNSTYVLVNDLQRSKIAYFLFYLVCKIVGASPMVQNDGLISIKKGFIKKELQKIFSMEYHYQMTWRWAFRYEIILQKR